jgi:leucyl/phenylalanyl-tRNA--protein transferase
MSQRGQGDQGLTPELLIRAYAAGIFPMAESAEDPAVFWVDPKVRGVLPLDAMHVPRRLQRTVKNGAFEVRCDAAFARVIDFCAKSRPGSRETWINRPIRDAMIGLHRMGLAHSVETWREGLLVGGLYGVALGGAFFGESMFSLERDASKVALVNLVARLRLGGFRLLDVQFTTDHLKRFGVVEIPGRAYLDRLEQALAVERAFPAAADVAALAGEIGALFTESRNRE